MIITPMTYPEQSAGSTFIRSEQSTNPLEIDGIKKGFNPETLTFDGVKIKQGDEVLVFGERFGVVDAPALSVNIFQHHPNRQNDEYLLVLEMLNITAHYPKQSGLEIAREELHKLEYELVYDLSHTTYIDKPEEKLERYCELKKRLEELTNK